MKTWRRSDGGEILMSATRR